MYDNGGQTFDRYTVIYMDQPETKSPYGQLYACLGMSDRPFHPQGFGMHSSATPGRHLGQRIPFAFLPDACQQAVRKDLHK